MNELWNLSGGLKHFRELIEYNNHLKQLHNVDKNFFESTFDSIHGLRWNGGRAQANSKMTLEEAVKRIKALNEEGIGFHFTFSNLFLKGPDMNDKDCNWLLEQCSNPLNGVVIGTDIVAKHVKENYPDYKTIASIAQCHTDIDFYKQANELYDVVVLWSDFNRDLQAVSQMNTSKLEVLVNQTCPDKCPFRAEHYRQTSKFVLDINEGIDCESEIKEYSKKCFAVRNGFERDHGSSLTHEEINALMELGVKRFKMVGREHTWDTYHKSLQKFIEQR